MRHSRPAVLFFAVLSAYLPVAAAPPLFVGVLEEEPDNPLSVRAAFRKTADGWTAMPSDCPNQACLASISAQYPARIDWTVAFDGRALGKVSAQTPASYDAYAFVGRQIVLQPQKAPRVNGRNAKFAGGMGSIPARRPLVTVSQPSTADPDHWKPASLDARSRALLRQAFHRHFPSEINCRDPVENKGSPWAYGDADIRVTNTYADRRGWRLANLVLIHDHCDGIAEGGFETQTFALSPDGKAMLLDRGLTLVDAGDYDGDGRSELVFAVSRYDLDGYALVYDDFHKKVEFTFHYH